MATFDELMAALRKADAAGDVEAAKAIAREAARIRPAQGRTAPALALPDSAPVLACRLILPAPADLPIRSPR